MATLTIRPNATGDENNINNQIGAAAPNHYQNVDEVTADGLTTAVYTINASYLRDLYNLTNHTSETGTINSVTVYGLFGTTTGITCYCKLSIKTNGTTYDGAEQSFTGTEAVDTVKSEAWNTNPQTAAAWTWDEIDALQSGPNVKSGTGADGSVCTQIYVEVDYTPGAPAGEVWIPQVRIF